MGGRDGEVERQNPTFNEFDRSKVALTEAANEGRWSSGCELKEIARRDESLEGDARASFSGVVKGGGRESSRSLLAWKERTKRKGE